VPKPWDARRGCNSTPRTNTAQCVLASRSTCPHHWDTYTPCNSDKLLQSDVVPCRVLCFNAIQRVHHNGHCCQQGRRYRRVTRDSEKRPPARQQGGVVVRPRALCSQPLPRQSNNVITRSSHAAQKHHVTSRSPVVRQWTQPLKCPMVSVNKGGGADLCTAPITYWVLHFSSNQVNSTAPASRRRPEKCQTTGR